jgi:hypothetical protein
MIPSKYVCVTETKSPRRSKSCNNQRCSPRDCGLCLERDRDRFFVVLVLVLRGEGLGLGLDTYGFDLGLGLEVMVSTFLETEWI